MCLCCIALQSCHRATLKVRFHTSGHIRGVAYLDDSVSKIYAICENWNTISVFHAAPPYEQLRGIHVSGLRDPTDMAACPTNMLLYVADRAEGCVWQVTTGGKVDWRLPTWSPIKRKASAVCPVSLSVRFGRLALVETGRIAIYDPHDDKADAIEFPDSVTLHHATETDHHSVLVALSDINADTSGSTIQEMHKAGDGTWCPTREWNLNNSVTSQMRINQPLYMALDQLGLVYVVIRDSHKVLVLDNTLYVTQTVLLGRRSVPSRLCLLAPKRKLFLVADAGSAVNVYDAAFPAVEYTKRRRYVTL